MNKIVKRILLGIGIIIVLLLLVSGGFFLKFRSEVKDMNPIPTGRVAENVFAVQDSFVNMFLVKDDDPDLQTG